MSGRAGGNLRLRRVARLRGAGVVLVVAGLLAACGGGTAPEGFVRHDGETFALAHPEGWEVGQREGESFAALGETGAGGVRQAAIVQVDPGFSGDFGVTVDGLNDLADVEFTDRQVVADDELDVEGAQAGRLLQTAYRTTAEDGATVDMRQFDLFALSGDETLHYLRVNAPRELFDGVALRQIVDSFALSG